MDGIEPTVDAMVQAGMQAMITAQGGLAFQARHIIPKLALGRRLPMCAYSRETFEDGALLSYAADLVEMCRRSPVFVDKILKGAKPREIPVEQPTKLELLINLKTAKALGIVIPKDILLRADEVIQ
jgi:putative ABC transport system substrate-binding protein